MCVRGEGCEVCGKMCVRECGEGRCMGGREERE